MSGSESNGRVECNHIKLTARGAHQRVRQRSNPRSRTSWNPRWQTRCHRSQRCAVARCRRSRWHAHARGAGTFQRPGARFLAQGCAPAGPGRLPALARHTYAPPPVRSCYQPSLAVSLLSPSALPSVLLLTTLTRSLALLPNANRDAHSSLALLARPHPANPPLLNT